ncbi:MAG TPA: aminotransferase class III-fold pyridoxal phosphate-dependent enzyme, partial [Thermogutta sp.]|nr:aminotransferase class III-fold pyridoxal phosphate-dependent enzyme [Thermogutta sp.]
GVMLAKGDVATSLRPGMHASTFGGNPIAAAAGLATIEMIEEENLLARAQHISRIFQERLVAMQQGCSIIREVRIVGLMIGIELTLEGAPVVQECLNRGLLINCTHNTVIRLLPAMVMTDEQVHEGCDILEDVLKKYAAGKL